MVVGRPYNLRMRRKQQEERLSPPPSSSPPPPPSHRGRNQLRRSKRLAVFKARCQLCIAVPSPTRQSVSEAKVIQPPPPSPSPSSPLPPPPSPPAAGNSGELLVDVSSEEENKKPDFDDTLSGLNPPPRSVERNGPTKFSEIIACVKSNLVSQLTSLPHSKISSMVQSANRDFTALDWYVDDYTSFRETVRRFIELNQELLEAEKWRNGHRAVSERYEELVIEANNAEEALSSAANLAEARENVVCARRRLEELRGLVIEAEMQLGQGEAEVVAWESKVRQCSEFHSRAEVDMQRVGSEDEEARKIADEVEERRKKALIGIELVKEELLRSIGAP